MRNATKALKIIFDVLAVVGILLITLPIWLPILTALSVVFVAFLFTGFAYFLAALPYIILAFLIWISIRLLSDDG